MTRSKKEKARYDADWIILEGMEIYCTGWGLSVDVHEDHISSHSNPVKRKGGWKKLRIHLEGDLEQQLKLIKALAKSYNYDIAQLNKTAQKIVPLVQLEQIAPEQEPPKVNGAA
jgi:hypothetical protein